jgi:hypothetical protein
VQREREEREKRERREERVQYLRVVSNELSKANAVRVRDGDMRIDEAVANLRDARVRRRPPDVSPLRPAVGRQFQRKHHGWDARVDVFQIVPKELAARVDRQRLLCTQALGVVGGDCDLLA